MDTALPQKIPFILDRNLAKANCTEDHVCTSCDKVVLGTISCCLFFWDVDFFFGLFWLFLFQRHIPWTSRKPDCKYKGREDLEMEGAE